MASACSYHVLHMTNFYTKDARQMHYYSLEGPAMLLLNLLTNSQYVPNSKAADASDLLSYLTLHNSSLNRWHFSKS